MIYLDDLAVRLQVPFRFARLPATCRAYLLEGEIVLNEDLTPERAHWAYCHEVAHLRLGHPANFPHDESENSVQESEANRLASEILLPQDQFLPHIHQSLLKLKQSFPFASFEVLARRRMHFRPGLLTIFDNGERTTRLAPDGWNLPARLFPLEDQAYRECWKTKGEIVLPQESQRVEATFIDEGRGVLRVILFLEGEEGGL